MSDNVINAAELDDNLALDADIAVIGTGAGGATAAASLAGAGLKVVMLETGPYQTSRNFHMLESEAYANLYHDFAGRQTKNNTLTVVQGRCVGGSTVVNWTSSFRIPAQTLAVWRDKYGLSEYTETELKPYFDATGEELEIGGWEEPPNANNQALWRGGNKLGWSMQKMQRNVKGCADLGYCGVGCPIDAKQSMLITRIPEALAHGATLVHHAYAKRFKWKGDRIEALTVAALKADCSEANNKHITVRASRFIAAGGGINTPALLLRSDLPDPHGRIGVRTFLHPVVFSAAFMPEKVKGWAGAPQSVYSDEFLWKYGVDGPMGYKIETAPLQPVFALTILSGFGEEHAELATQLPHLHVQAALLRDGFHPYSAGGRVEIDDHGGGVLDYPFNDYFWDGVRRAMFSLAESQFAAGAERVMPGHSKADQYASWPEARAAIENLEMNSHDVRLASAHVMGGCGMGADPRNSVVDGDGRYHHLENLFIMDGSVFPTSLGVNPQWTIYALTKRMSERLINNL